MKEYCELGKDSQLTLGIERDQRSAVLQRWENALGYTSVLSHCHLQLTWQANVIEALGRRHGLVISNQNEGTAWRKQQPGVLLGRMTASASDPPEAQSDNTNHGRNEQQSMFLDLIYAKYQLPRRILSRIGTLLPLRPRL